MNKFTIAFIEPHLRLVGGIRRIMEVSTRLQKLGHLVTIHTPQGTPCKWFPSSVKVLSLKNLLNHEYTFVLFNLAEQYEQALKAHAKYKIFWVLAPEAQYKDPKIPIMALQQKFYFMANSTYTAAYVKRYKKDLVNIPIIPGGINPEHFKHDPTILKRYSVLYYGSSRPWKGTHIIEEAISPLRVKTIKMEGLGTPQEKMYQLYNSAEITVVANQKEGFSFVELESMACGTPVVCTDSGGNMDYVKNGINAIVVPRTVLGLQSGVSRLLSDKVLRTNLKNAGLNTVANPLYSWDDITGRLEQTLYSFIK